MFPVVFVCFHLFCFVLVIETFISNKVATRLDIELTSLLNAAQSKVVFPAPAIAHAL